MVYYDRSLKKININDTEYLNCGECAKIFYNKDIVFKEYFSDAPLDCRLTPKRFDILKDVNNSHFIKLLNIYSSMNLFELLEYKVKVLDFITDAYTTKYYDDDKVDALYVQTDYIMDNLRELELLFDDFTDNGIVTDDIKRKNAILSPKGIVIIDPDSFYMSTEPTDLISIKNKLNLLDLIRSICVDSMIEKSIIDDRLSKIMELVDIKVDRTTDVTHEVSKKLKHFKRPIEYFMK